MEARVCDLAWLGLPGGQEAEPCVSVTATLPTESDVHWEPQEDSVSARGHKPQLSLLRGTRPSPIILEEQ